MTVNSEKVLNYLKTNYGREFTKQEIADALNITVPAVTGTMNALIKKGYATTVHEDKVVTQEATDTRKEQFKMIKYHTLTESGLAYDPVAEEAAKAEQKAAEKARKAAEKAGA